MPYIFTQKLISVPDDADGADCLADGQPAGIGLWNTAAVQKKYCLQSPGGSYVLLECLAVDVTTHESRWNIAVYRPWP